MSENCKLKKTLKIFDSDENIAGSLQYNMFSEEIEFAKKVEWCFSSVIKGGIRDTDIIQLKNYMSKIHNWEPSREIIEEGCFLIACNKRYHPIKEYIESIGWDGIPRIDEWLIKAVNCEDNYYTRMAASKFLIATINRIYNPGCKFDHMLILEGPQNIGKSTLVEIMAGDWYLDTNFESRDKDLIDSMRGSFWIEISELSGMNKQEVDWLKSFLSRKVDRIRLPYGRRAQDFKRKCVFIGTYNPSGNNMYLRDDTGNRRFWPIECRGIVNFNYIRENRTQLWAEALHRYGYGEKYYIDNPTALEILDNIHQERELESPTQIMIKNWLIERKAAQIIEVSMQEIIENCLKINMNGKSPKDLLSIATTVGIIMRKLKWQKGRNKDRDKYRSPESSWE